MTSMLCRKEKGGQVLVHDTGLIDILKIDNNDQITRMVSKQRSAHRRRMPRPNTTPSPVRIRSASSGNMDSKCLIGQTMKVQDWLNEKTLKTLQEKSDLESKAVRKLYSPILETEDTFVKEVEQFINQKDLSNLRKKEVLHKNWNERVYKPLRKKIIEAMDGDDWPEVDRRKRELHRQYLEFNNDKGHVFLDTMDPEEYYALALNGHRPAPIKDKVIAKPTRKIESAPVLYATRGPEMKNAAVVHKRFNSSGISRTGSGIENKGGTIRNKGGIIKNKVTSITRNGIDSTKVTKEILISNKGADNKNRFVSNDDATCSDNVAADKVNKGVVIPYCKIAFPKKTTKILLKKRQQLRSQPQSYHSKAVTGATSAAGKRKCASASVVTKMAMPKEECENIKRRQRCKTATARVPLPYVEPDKDKPFRRLCCERSGQRVKAVVVVN